MRQFGLIGKTLAHSFSQSFFNQKFNKEKINDASYDLFEFSNEHDVSTFLKDKNFEGVNVTIPYKQSVIPFLDKLSNEAKTVRAVNCIKQENGLLKGYNTDVYGFEESLKPFMRDDITKALMLGTGGAAKAVKYVLSKLGLEFLEVSRVRSKTNVSYADLDASILSRHLLIVNTTPLGMYPNIDDAPDIPYSALTNDHILYDLIYNPQETTFLARGKQLGCKTKNGEEMLVLQAEKSWAIWNNHIAQTKS